MRRGQQMESIRTRRKTSAQKIEYRSTAPGILPDLERRELSQLLRPPSVKIWRKQKYKLIIS